MAPGSHPNIYSTFLVYVSRRLLILRERSIELDLHNPDANPAKWQSSRFLILCPPSC